jgi:ribosomal protein S18 acetylase RimI-like enzyme
MAAQLNPALERPFETVDLRRLAARDLDSLLEEETAAWREELEWDFGGSADLVRRFVDLHALNGAALLENGEATGYAYYVLEDDKGLVGDLYVRQSLRTTDRENALLDWALKGISSNPAILRIEAQIMMLGRDAARVLPAATHASAFERNFMRVETTGANLDEGQIRRPCYIEKWSSLYQDPAAQLVAAAYAGHIDGRINDQYRSVAGASRFLHNIMNYPGCGVFCPAASWAAFEAASGRLCGISLVSMVAPECGHITQICTSPAARGMGIGHQLLRQSLMTLRDMGCRSTSLTVTAANENAVKLYERVGFRTVRRFPAFVWEGFRG